VTVLVNHDWLSDWECVHCGTWGFSGSVDERRCDECGAELCDQCAQVHDCA
jgi:hypothetical protein